MSKGTESHLLTRAERYILDTVQGLRYGTVEITVHDGRIAQVQVSEKFRFDDRSTTGPASGGNPPRG